MTRRLGVRPAALRLVDPALAARVSAPAADIAPVSTDGPDVVDPLSYRNVLRTTDAAVDRPAVLRRNREALERLLRAGVFGPPRRRFAWYRLAVDDHVQTGLLAEVALRDYLDGRIVRHEHTRAEREQLLADHQRVVAADSSPVALAMVAGADLRALAARAATRTPDVGFVADDGVEHTVWSVDDAAAVGAICVALAAVDRLYITDGHHRLAAAATVAETRRGADGDDAADQWLLAALFPHDELQILAFHRAVTRPHGPTTAQLLAELETCGRVTPLASIAAPARRRHFAVRLDERWYGLEVPASPAAGPLDQLDVTVLHERVLAPVLGVTEPRFDPRLTYVAGGPAAVAAHCARAHAMGFMMRPTSMEELMHVADAELVMPPKSTLFSPKVRAGIVLRRTG